jgi:hypothetical protein
VLAFGFASFTVVSLVVPKTSSAFAASVSRPGLRVAGNGSNGAAKPPPGDRSTKQARRKASPHEPSNTNASADGATTDTPSEGLPGQAVPSESYIALEATKCVVVKSKLGVTDVGTLPGDLWASSCVVFTDKLVCMSWFHDPLRKQIETKQSRWLSPYALVDQSDPGFLVYEGTEGQKGSLYFDFVGGQSTGRFSYTTTRIVGDEVMHKHCVGALSGLAPNDPRLDWWTEQKK